MQKLAFLFAFILCAYILRSQTIVDEQIKSIRKEYLSINSNLNTLIKNEVYYTDDKAYWNNTRYTAYYNLNHQLVRLNFAIGEEGYWSEVEYYFKDGQIMFIYIYSGEPDGSEKQERIYFWKSEIFHALIKLKAAGDKRTFSDIPNKPHRNIMNNLGAETKKYLESIENELQKFYEAAGK